MDKVSILSFLIANRWISQSWHLDWTPTRAVCLCKSAPVVSQLWCSLLAILNYCAMVLCCLEQLLLFTPDASFQWQMKWFLYIFSISVCQALKCFSTWRILNNNMHLQTQDTLMNEVLHKHQVIKLYNNPMSLALLFSLLQTDKLRLLSQRQRIQRFTDCSSLITLRWLNTIPPAPTILDPDGAPELLLTHCCCGCTRYGA